MTFSKIIAIVLMAGGIFALVYGGFSYTREDTAVKLGPVEVAVQDKETVNIPVWAGVGAIAAGGIILLLGKQRS